MSAIRCPDASDAAIILLSRCISPGSGWITGLGFG